MTIYAKFGITSYPNNTNPLVIVQSNQYHFLPNKTAQETISKKEKLKTNKFLIQRFDLSKNPHAFNDIKDNQFELHSLQSHN